MARYYLHLRDFEGVVLEDEEGSELPSLAAAKACAIHDMHDLIGDAIKQTQMSAEARLSILLNLKTAKELGLVIPREFLLLADEVIE